MDMLSFKVLELILVVGVVGYFYVRQKRTLERLRQEREDKQAKGGAEGGDESSNRG